MSNWHTDKSMHITVLSLCKYKLFNNQILQCSSCKVAFCLDIFNDVGSFINSTGHDDDDGLSSRAPREKSFVQLLFTRSAHIQLYAHLWILFSIVFSTLCIHKSRTPPSVGKRPVCRKFNVGVPNQSFGS